MEYFWSKSPPLRCLGFGDNQITLFSTTYNAHRAASLMLCGVFVCVLIYNLLMTK